MKSKCPQCGFDLGDEDRDTVIDRRVSADSIPRLSDIDRRWETSVHDEPTRLQSVPYFKMPESLLQMKKELSDSQRPTPMRPPRPPRPWLIVVFAMVVGVGVGAAAAENEAAIFRTFGRLHRWATSSASSLLR